MFTVDIEYNSSHFYAPKDLIHVFWCDEEKHITFLLLALSPTLLPVLNPVPGPTLHPALRIAQKQWAIWRLWYWRPLVNESGTWVLLLAAPSSY
jgi:hypothetical protein